jgi:KipI family sensor histidine kinase inhibitor
MAEGWPRVSRLGEETWLVELEPRLDPDINAHVHRVARAIAAARLQGIRDIVPGIASVGVHVDGDRIDPISLGARLRDLALAPPDTSSAIRCHDVPVCYEPPFALDLEDVAARCGCPPDVVVARHSGVEYRVFMIGFLPGFPYLGVLDRSLALPRRDAPRVRVPAGSVAIAGQHTGIYPAESPGGWHVIGRTPISLFDPAEVPPARFAPEDRVRFTPISAERFAEISHGGHA